MVWASTQSGDKSPHSKTEKDGCGRSRIENHNSDVARHAGVFGGLHVQDTGLRAAANRSASQRPYPANRCFRSNRHRLRPPRRQRRDALHRRTDERRAGHVRLRRDGLIDVYFLNGAPMRGTKVTLPPKDRLYRNEGGWRFRDVTDEAGVGDTGFGLGVTVGDYDNDGYPDLYLNNFGPNVLYRNNGDGTFTDVTAAAGVANGDRVGAGGLLPGHGRRQRLGPVRRQLRQVRLTKDHVSGPSTGFPGMPVPRDFQPEPDSLYRNNGDGTFTDVSGESGVRSVAGTRMGMVCVDYDQDGDTDIFASDDVSANFSIQNDGAGKFEEVGILNGTAYNFLGTTTAAWASIAATTTTTAGSTSS